MTGADDRVYDTDVLDVSSTHVLVGDGTMGTQPPAADGVDTKFVRLHSG
nr:hypothetical protein [Mycobacterium sp. NAZ190054]